MICPPRADCIATNLPREGPEKYPIDIQSDPFLLIEQPIHLARGRKHTNHLQKIFFAQGIDTYLPREGPETFSVFLI